ncbi:PREDICTED: 3'-hydroxy-N-methyl-(S)-coclaurine 4'-O-methyltransferase 1-like [Prunus mume]|uniref:3'-hydroxy-N-methyl-(S)-coclaurine 4'-O-methyltransferase 1-like n=1 Tax=Prunus mume TaxID=102107 RepID=A0ABM1LSN8_PRUMU|nr:PREDICTED: 3'-hydroxy-N-methyl-(S)-coclaurine 4'-O-methyltransferase 1-like [Prunus mume]
MTGPPSSSYPGQVPPPAAVISPENEEKSSGFDKNFTGFVLRRPAAIFGDPGFGRFWVHDSGHFQSDFWWVLDDWGNDECIRILKKCREATPEDKGKVIIVEVVIDEKDEKEDIKLTNLRLMLDMVKMAHTNTGKERTLKEWEYVLGEAGFSRHTITPIHAVCSVIQAFP